MLRTVASLTSAFVLILVAGSVEVSGQVPCAVVGGFATLRDLVGPQTAGDCVEDERLNAENGNVEQHTSGGLLLRRDGSTITAFTDGVTTWLNGPNGLESRPNGNQFSWEVDLAAALPSWSSISPLASPAPLGAASPGALAASPAALPAANTLPSPGTTASQAAVTAPASVPTPTPTPKPAVTVKLREKPNRVETGSDARFEVETNVDKGSCTLVVAYRNQDDATVAGGQIDDNRCEMEYTLPKDAKTGKATAKITVTGPEGTATIDDDFDVRKGDMVLAGDINIEIEPDDIPDEVEVGDEIKIAVKTSLKDKGKCEMGITWPKYTPYNGAAQTPDDGRCSWKLIVPNEIPKKGTATLIIVVRKNNKKDSTELRYLTKEIEVKK